MIKNIYSIAKAKGFQIIKTPKCIYLPIINKYLRLPIWFAWEPEFKSKKGCQYTLKAFIIKQRLKAERKRLKKNNKHLQLA
jgi:hypothetical protein